MLFEKTNELQENKLRSNTYISETDPELDGDCENGQAYTLTILTQHRSGP